MKLIFKQPYESKYEKILKILQEAFPDKQFKILTAMGEVFDDEYGIAVKTGWLSWHELDLKAMGLLQPGIKLSEVNYHHDCCD